jgi:hypothetical protein
MIFSEKPVPAFADHALKKAILCPSCHAERIYSSLAMTLLAARREDPATGLWLRDRRVSRAFTGGAIDFRSCFFGVRSLHDSLLRNEENHFHIVM